MSRRAKGVVVLAAVAAMLCGGLVIARGQSPTSTQLAVSPPATFLGQPVTLTATVVPAAGGSVTFYDGTTIIGVGPIASGIASITTPLLDAGGRSLWAAFTGNGIHLVSVSPIVLHTVTAKAGRGFRPPAAVATPLPAAGLVVADFNADGFADVAAALPRPPAGNGDERGKIDVLLGAGDGTLHRSATITLTDPAVVAAADFDSDGRTDLVATDGGLPYVVVLRGNGDGTFASPTQHFVGMNPSIVVVADFNADGRSDIAAMRADGDNILLLGNGNGSFQPPAFFLTGAQPFAAAVGDVDGDWIDDLVVAGDGPLNGDLFLVRGSGAGLQPPVRLSETANGIRGLAIGDVNGDGRNDVIAGNTLTDTVDVFAGTATGVAPPASFPAAAPGSIVLADVNGDGYVDAITSSSSLSGVNVLPGNGDGTFEPVRNDGSGANPKFVAAGEFNGDGVPDLVVSSHTESTVAVLAGISIDDVFLSATPISALAPAPASLIATLPADAQGTVTFYNGTATLGTVPVSAGAAALTTGPLPRGHHTIRAVHSGDAIRGSTEASVVITRSGESVVRLVASHNPSSAFEDVTFVATVEQASGAAAIPTGTITFTRTEATGPGEVITAPLVNGTATLVKSRLRRGIHQLSAHFDGDALFTPATSPVLTQEVKQDLICTVTSSPNPSRPGEPVLITAECAGANPQIVVGTTPVAVSLSALGNGFVRGTASIVLSSPGLRTIYVTPGVNQYTFQIVGGQSSITITNLNDSGVGSLRWAIGEAAAGDVVVFAPGITGSAIHLMTPVVIDKPLTLMGPGSTVEAIDGFHLTQLLVIKSGGVTVSGLTLRNGVARGGAGGNGFAGGGGAGGLGGAVFVDTDDTVPIHFEDVRFEGNRAMGGRGGNGMFLTKPTALQSMNGGGGGVDDHRGQDGAFVPTGGWGGDGGSLGGLGGRIFGDAVGASGTNGGPGAGGGGSITPGVGGSGGFGGGGGGGNGYGGSFGGGGGSANPGTGVGSQGEWAGSGGAAQMSKDCPGGILALCGLTEYWGGAGGGGGAGLGGALFIYRGIVVVGDTAFLDNAASGGDGGTTPSTPYLIFSNGPAPARGMGMGGGYYVHPPGTLLMRGDFPRFAGNFAQDPGAGRPADFEGPYDNTSGFGSLSTYLPTGASARGPLHQTAVAGSVFSSPMAIDIDLSLGSVRVPVDVTFELFGGPTFVDGSRVAHVIGNFTAASPFIRAGAEPGSYAAVARWSNYTVTFGFTVTPSIPLTTTITAASGHRPGSSTTLRADVSSDVVGPVGFLDDVRFVGNAALQDRAALLTTRALRPGLHGLRAVYSGHLEVPPNSSDTLWRQVTNRQSASFAVANSLGGSLSSLAAGELQPDRIDLVGLAEDGIRIFRQDASGGYSAPELVATGDPPTSFGMADFDGDGRRDLAVLTTNPSTAESRLRLFMQHATWVQTESFLLDPGTRTLAIGDINADGQPDIAVIGIAPRVHLWFGLATPTGHRWFDMKTPLFEASGGLVFDALVIDDFNGDGVAEIAVTNRQAWKVHLLMRDYTGEFAVHPSFDVGAQPTAAASGDINGDGLADLVIGTADSSVPAVLFGRAGISFDGGGGVVRSTRPGAVSALAIADFDGDGREDIAATDATASTITLIQIPPGNSVNLEPWTTYTIAGAPRGVVAADFDDDGRTDLAVASPDEGVISILKGQPGTAAVTWQTPNAIAPGTALGSAQLNATANRPGSFLYSPPAGTVLAAGLQTLSVTFTPQDDGIAPVTASVEIWVRIPTFQWRPSPSSIDPDMPLSFGQLNAVSEANGTFAYTQAIGELYPATGLLHDPPLDWTLTAHFEPVNLRSWAPMDVSVVLTVHRRVPEITWNPAPIPFGFPIGPRLNAIADIPGSFSYTPFDDFVPLHSGPLDVTAAFFPDHPLRHAEAHKTVVLEIQAVPTTIDLQPMSIAACEGRPAQLSVSATATTLVYQWRRNGQPIQVDGTLLSGVHTPTLTLSTPLDGIYDVLVNETASNPATVTTAYPPEVGIMPPNTTSAGQVLFINGSRTGQDYAKTALQWQFSADGNTWVDLAGATSEDLEIPNASTALNGFYRLVGTTACGTDTTPAVHASVERIEQFILGPFLDVQGPLAYGQTAALTGHAASGLPVSYTVLNGSVTIVDGHVHATGVGPFKIRITQNGDDLRYLPAAPEIYDGDVQTALLTAHLQPPRRTYGAPNPAPQFTFIGLVNGDTPAVVSGVTTFTQPPADYPAGTAGTSITRVLTAPNYRIEYDLSESLMVIEPAPLKIKLHDLAKIYGDPTPEITFEYIGLVLGQTSPTFANSLDLLAGWPRTANGDATLQAGSYPISASQESTNYAITVEPAALTVQPAPLTVSAQNLTRKYGAVNPPLTATFAGFRNGDSFQDGALGADFRLDTTATTTSPAGTYPITLGQALPRNYEINFEPGTLTIDAATLTVGVANATKFYGDPNPAFSPVFTGLVTPEEEAAFAASLTIATGATQTSTAGVYALTPSGITSSNYAVIYAPGTLTIKRAPLTITAGDSTRQYGGPNPPFETSYSGFVLDQDAGVLGGTLSFTTPPINAPVGSHPVTPGGLTSSNYAITFEAGSLVITRALLTMQAEDKSESWGSRLPQFTIAYTGLAGGDTPATAGGTVTTTAVDYNSWPGEYPLAVSGGPANNYDITYVEGVLTITKRRLTITVGQATRVYGEDNPPFAVDYSGFLQGQGPSVLDGALQFSTPATPRSDASSYPITASGLSSDFYDIVYVSGRLFVDPRPLVITAPSVRKTYGQPTPTLSPDQVDYNGFIFEDGPHQLTGTLQFITDDLTESTPPGEYFVFPLGVEGWPNYHVIGKSGFITIDRAPLIVRTDDVTTNYGEAVPQFTVSYQGFVLGQDASVVNGTPFFTPNHFQFFQAGEYSITPFNLSAQNYVLQYVPGTLKVKSLPLVITAVDASRLYGHANPSFTATYSGLREGDNLLTLQQGVLTLTTAATASSDVGEYPVTPAGVTVRNYDVQFVPATLTVTPSPLTVRANGQVRRYGIDNKPYTLSYSGFLVGDGPTALGGELEFDAPGAEAPVGTHAIVPSGLTSANYAITFQSGPLLVQPAILNVTPNDATRKFGMPNPPFTIHYVGFKNDDGPEVLQGLVVQSSATEASPVGQYGIHASGLSSANYEFDYFPGLLTVQPATLTVTADDASRPYGSLNPAFTAHYSGLIPGTENQVLGAVTFTTSGQFLMPIGEYDIVPAGLFSNNYDIAYVAGTLTIERAPVTVHAFNASRTYGMPNPPFIAFFTGFRNGESESIVQGTPTFTTAADQFSPVGTYDIVASASGLTVPNYFIVPAPEPGRLTITKATPQVSWTNPPDIRYPAALGANELNATAGIPGSFTYTSGPGTILAPGCWQQFAAFTPDDTINYASASATAHICVLRGQQHITWATPPAIDYGVPLDAMRLNASVSGDGAQPGGVLSYQPPLGSKLEGGERTLQVSAPLTPFYEAATATVTLTVRPVDQVITWNSPAPITYGTPLGGAQKNATVSVIGPAPAGQLTYTPSTFVNAGLQTLTVTAAATNNYKAATASVQIQVAKLTVQLSSMNGGSGRSFYDPPPPVAWFDLTLGLPFRVGMTSQLPIGTPAGSYRPVFVLDDPLGLAVNYELTTFELFYISNPPVSVIALDRLTAVKGSGPVEITITGDGFVPSCGQSCPPPDCEYCFVDTLGTYVQWNDTMLPVRFVSRNEVVATVPASLLTATGVAYVSIAGAMTKEFFITDSPTTIESAATGSAWGDPFHLDTGAIGEAPPALQIDTTTGEGSVTIATYTGNPGGALAGGDHFFDVYVAPGSTFQELTITTCALTEPTDQISWFNGTAWIPASHQTPIGGTPACVRVTVTEHTSPTIAQLTGTFFAAVGETAAPTITVAPNRTSLWPPDGKLVPVVVRGRTTGAVASANYQVIDEYAQAQPAGAITVAADGSYSFTVMLPASRLGSDKDGRTFTIKVSALDRLGNGGAAAAVIRVLHDQGKK